MVAQLAAQIQNGEGSAFFEWYQCINVCIERTDITDGQGCWERLVFGDGEWPSTCDSVYAQCGCGEQPVISEIDRCPVLAMIYIDTHLLPDLSNACAVLNYVKENYKCVPLPLEEEPLPIIDDEDDEWVNGEDPGEDYDEDQRKPIWWYHTDHLGSSTYLTDNFGRPSHYYETLPFGEMIVEHNQSANNPAGVNYANKWKFNGKELDDATGMYYYGARYYDPRISIFVSVDPLAEKTMTPYQYVHNNPVNFIDPTGMEADGWGKKNNTWEYKAEITADNYKDLGYSEYMASGSIFSTTNDVADGEYNFSLNENGTVTTANGSIQINFSFNTTRGTTISPLVDRQAQFTSLFSTAKEFVSTANSASEGMQMLGYNSPLFTKIGGAVGHVNTGFDFVEPMVDFSNDKIGPGRAAYRSGGVLFGAFMSAEVGAQVGSVFPGYGTAAGAATGLIMGGGFKMTEQAYDKVSSEVGSGYGQFINQIKANIAKAK